MNHELKVIATGWLVVAIFFVTLATCIHARAQTNPPAPPLTCPTPAPCKILFLTPDEEQALLGPKMVLDTAEQARPLDLLGIVKFFRQKIEQAPRGVPAPPPPAPSPEQK